MVRWFDGLFGGLLAGTAVALFYALLSAVWLHDTPLTLLFAEIAGGVLHSPVSLEGNGWAIAFGAALHLLACGIFGIVYALFARRIVSMWSAPTSLFWGLAFGLVFGILLALVCVPLFGISTTQPPWEALVANTLIYGFIISEFTTVAHRRQTEAA